MLVTEIIHWCCCWTIRTNWIDNKK